MKKIIISLISVLYLSCGNDPDPIPQPAGCNNVNTDFQVLYTNTLLSNPLFDNYTTMDLLTHEYSFTANANKTICTIGYQGNAVMYANNLPYTIEIYNVTTNTTIYTGNHLFNSTTTDYKTITPTNIIAGNNYVIRRIIPVGGYNGDLMNTIGRICRFNTGTVPYPVTQGAITITASDFYGTGGPVPNYGIPYIDIVFQ